MSAVTKGAFLAPLMWVGFMGVLGLNLDLGWGQSAVPTALMLPFVISLAWATEHGHFNGTDERPPIRRIVIVATGALAAGAVLYVFQLSPQ